MAAGTVPLLRSRHEMWNTWFERQGLASLCAARNTPAGGHTPQLLRIRPEEGTGVLVFPSTAGFGRRGSGGGAAVPDLPMLHGACTVAPGHEAWVAQQWLAPVDDNTAAAAPEEAAVDVHPPGDRRYGLRHRSGPADAQEDTRPAQEGHRPADLEQGGAADTHASLCNSGALLHGNGILHVTCSNTWGSAYWRAKVEARETERQRKYSAAYPYLVKH